MQKTSDIVERVHPIEHLRFLAGVRSGVDTGLLLAEAAQSLGACAENPPVFLTSAKTLLSHQPSVGPLWWLCAKMLAATDPKRAAQDCLAQFAAADTARLLAATIPDGVRVCVVGTPVSATAGLRRRSDVSVLAIETEYGDYFVEEQLSEADVGCETLGAQRLGAAVESADLVIVEPEAVGSSNALFEPGNFAAVAAARLSRTPVWLLCGPGRRLPDPFLEAMIQRVIVSAAVPWVADLEVVALGAVDQIVTANAVIDSSTPPAPDCPYTPELIGPR